MTDKEIKFILELKNQFTYAWEAIIHKALELNKIQDPTQEQQKEIARLLEIDDIFRDIYQKARLNSEK